MRQYCIWIILVSVWFGSVGFAPGETQAYSKAVRFAKTGHTHFAFMQYNKLLRNYPASEYRKQALFATGEYYFRFSNFEEAAASFKIFINEYPDSDERLYAIAYLLNIAHEEEDSLSIQDFEKEIIHSQQVSLVFRESKKVKYRSPLHQNYKVVIHIDKIEFYVEGRLFAKVFY